MCICPGVLWNLIERGVDEDLEQNVLTLAILDDPSGPQPERKVLDRGEGGIGVEPSDVNQKSIVALRRRDVNGVALVCSIDVRRQLVKEPGLTVDREP